MKRSLKSLFLLHLLLMVYSTSGILSKSAAKVSFLSLEFCLMYAGILALLGLYALGWQQILKKMALTTAFSNKAVTIVWGIIWGALFFAEPVTLPKVGGALLIIAGVVLFSHADIEAASQETTGADVLDRSSSVVKNAGSENRIGESAHE